MIVTSGKTSIARIGFIPLVLSTDSIMSEGREEVSQKSREFSRKSQERPMYSVAADVAEMEALCGEIADRLAPSRNAKDRVRVVQKALADLDVSWNRALELLTGKARRIDSCEKDLARDRVAALRRIEEQRKAGEHLAWLREQINRHRASDEELRGPHIDALEHLLCVAGGDAGPVAVPAETVTNSLPTHSSRRR